MSAAVCLAWHGGPSPDDPWAWLTRLARRLQRWGAATEARVRGCFSR